MADSCLDIPRKKRVSKKQQTQPVMNGIQSQLQATLPQAAPIPTQAPTIQSTQHLLQQLTAQQIAAAGLAALNSPIYHAPSAQPQPPLLPQMQLPPLTAQSPTRQYLSNAMPQSLPGDEYREMYMQLFGVSDLPPDNSYKTITPPPMPNGLYNPYPNPNSRSMASPSPFGLFNNESLNVVGPNSNPLANSNGAMNPSVMVTEFVSQQPSSSQASQFQLLQQLQQPQLATPTAALQIAQNVIQQIPAQQPEQTQQQQGQMQNTQLAGSDQQQANNAAGTTGRTNEINFLIQQVTELKQNLMGVTADLSQRRQIASGKNISGWLTFQQPDLAISVWKNTSDTPTGCGASNVLVECNEKFVDLLGLLQLL